MIRTLIFMALIAMSMLIASCGPTACFKPLGPTARETLKIFKKEVHRTITLTTENMKSNEVDFQVGNKIIDSLTATIKQFDSLTVDFVHLEKTGTREEILLSAERTSVIINSVMTNLK